MALRAIAASFVVHVGVAAGLVASGRGGHAVPGAPVSMTAEIVELDTSEESIETPMPVAEQREEAKTERTNVVAPPPDHTHPYPVPGHDARPHDPSQPHAHDGDHDDEHEHEQEHEHEHEQGAPMPTFTIASGAGSMAAGSTRVADARANSAGSGRAAGESAGSSAGSNAANVTYSASGVSVAAKLVSSVTATYPADARADDVEGDVVLEIIVDAEGRVVDARVVKQAGHGFDESALSAIRRYRFSAAQRDGRNVRVRMPWTVQFRLR